ncbi:MAG TPA: pitrilysin family protein [Phycisphaerales bacterium]|nr:pitrilysin family protein [Phycisphaerales bacterium]
MSTIHTRALDCGMPLLVEVMPSVRSAAVYWMLPAGSATDPDDREGVSTMLEELLLRGAGARSSKEHADAADRLGATRGTSTGTFTMGISSTMLGERVCDVLPLLVDMVRTPRLDADAIEATRDLSLQAIESLKDDPQERAMLAARARHNPHPINRSGMGTVEGLRSITRADLTRYWERVARPQGSAIGIAGAVDPDRVQRTLNDLLAGWSGAAPVPAIGPVPTRGYAHEDDESSQVQIVVAYDAPAEPSPDAVLEKLAVSVLSGGMSGRLFTEVREKRGLCYSVSAGYRGDREFGTVTAYVGTAPERAQQSLDVLLAELRRITTAEGRVTEEEFRRAKVGMKSGLVFSGESTGARAGALVTDWRRLGRPRTLAEIAAEIEGVTLDQLNAYLAKRTLGTLTIQTLGPASLAS